VGELGILIIDDDEQGRAALLHVLDAEGWRVRVVPMAADALAEIARGEWHLVIANVAMTGLDTPLFTTLKDLALAPALDSDEAAAPRPDAASPRQVGAGRPRVRVLFLLPAIAPMEVQAALEDAGLPYALKPFHLHDFLERVSDLLLETRAIAEPIRRVRQSAAAAERRERDRRTDHDRRAQMFTAREDYQMTEEEIAEFERQEEEERRKREKEKEPH